MFWLIDIARFFLRPLYWLAGRLFGIWAHPTVQPEAPAELFSDADAEICYVLESGGLADLLALERACAKNGLPSPTESFMCCGKRISKRFVVLRPRTGFIVRRPSPQGSRGLKYLVESANDVQEDLLLIPVAIYWGRSPDKEPSTFKLLFAENWEALGRIRKFFATIIFGRDTLMRFSDALPLSSIIQQGLEPEIAFRKVSRVLRVHFRQRRTAYRWSRSLAPAQTRAAGCAGAQCQASDPCRGWRRSGKDCRGRKEGPRLCQGDCSRHLASGNSHHGPCAATALEPDL